MKSDSDRLLEALSDGQEHDHRSLYFGLNVMVHSRAADLRRRGYDIQVRREGSAYLYKLVREPTPARPGAPPATSPEEALAASPTDTDWRDLLPEAEAHPVQMVLGA